MNYLIKTKTALKTFFNSISFSRGAYSLIDPNQSQKEGLRYSQSFLAFRHIRLKLCYFFILAAYCSCTYLSLFFSTVFQLPKPLIGILLSVSPFVGLISSPFWSIIADRHDAHRKIMISCITCVVFVYWSIPFTGKYFGFGGLFINLVIYSLFDGGVSPLLDNLTMNVLYRKGDSAEFGRQRLFGTISYGIFVATIGFLIDRFNSLYVMFFAFGFFMGLLILVLYSTPDRDFKIDHHDELITDNIDLDQIGSTSNETLTQIVDSDDMVAAPPSFMKAILKLITKPRLLLFLFVLLSTRTVKSSTSTFLYVFLSEDLKADAALMGLSTFVGVTLEILVFYYGKHILEFTFPEVIIIGGGILTTLRASLYAFFGTSMNPWLSLPIELLQGLEFGLVKPASLEIVLQQSPPKLRGTALGILAATENLSTALGQIVGGILYGHFGSVKMFLYSAWIGILAIIIYIVGLSMQKKRFYLY
ncbi:major facilitator superfamily domain-containing protein [Gigaspora rosea]|uniref:Major facilitator superfamily domain-containing protein n=1 Tax=Gigaspora rosea TaxID=44941 RepID=A0A397U6Z6_9GLOM|nr:major facilitator superfamily domain-containing protein [Gigaspora rosea]